MYEYQCTTCDVFFEEIRSAEDRDGGKCPHCQSETLERQISAPWVGGQGDLRESTLHGCHDHDGLDTGSKKEDHGHHCGHDHGYGHGKKKKPA